MQALATAPGVLGSATTTYVTAADVMMLLGCKNNKAYQSIRAVNQMAKAAGMLAYGQGKASKYLFSEQYGIPLEVVDAVIDMNRGSGGQDGVL